MDTNQNYQYRKISEVDLSTLEDENEYIIKTENSIYSYTGMYIKSYPTNYKEILLPVPPPTQVSDDMIKIWALIYSKAVEDSRWEEPLISGAKWMRSQLTSQQAPQQSGKDKELYILREFQKMCNESLSPEMLDMLDKIKERLFLNRRGLK